MRNNIKLYMLQRILKLSVKLSPKCFASFTSDFSANQIGPVTARGRLEAKSAVLSALRPLHND